MARCTDLGPRLLGVIAFLIGAVAIGNYYYYQTYHTHIDVFAFGLMEDDTQAVLGNMWQDYPIIQSLLLSLLLGWLPARWARRTLVQRERKPWPLTVFIVYLLAALTLLFVISRGSIGTFPLRRGNAQVSDLLALNKLTPNGFMAIDWAIKDREEDIAFNPVSHAEGETLLAEVGLTPDGAHPAQPLARRTQTQRGDGLDGELWQQHAGLR